MQNSRSVCHEHIKAHPSSFINTKVAVTVINGGMQETVVWHSSESKSPCISNHIFDHGNMSL